MDARTKVTKEVLCEESRFILANVLAEARYGRQNRYDDIRRVCEAAVTIPFGEYVTFLHSTGYMRHDEAENRLIVTPLGEEIVNGGNLTELTAAAVNHFKNVRMRRRKDGSGDSVLPEPPVSTGTTSPPPPPGSPAALALAAARKAGISSGGRDRAVVGGEISSSELIDSRYEKIAIIGSGGVGTVFRARQVPLAREVALKEVRELFGFFAGDQHGEIVRRFTEVVHAAAGLTHPNILPVHDVNLDREHPYVVSELAPNGSARRLIADAETIPVGLALKYLLQTLHALRAAHGAGVTHRGLKPENMLLDAYGNVKVADFGFARIVERDATVIRQVYVGVGAVAYMAPELFVDPASAGVQADIYALGIIFYELLARKLPGRRSPMPSELDPKLPRGVDDVFDTMTRDSRTERYATVDDILEDFDKIDGLDEVLDRQPQFRFAENPLAAITFREAPTTTTTTAPAPAGPAAAAAGGSTIAAPAPGAPVEAEHGEESRPNLDDEGKRRPYSFQQRQPKP